MKMNFKLSPYLLFLVAAVCSIYSSMVVTATPPSNLYMYSVDRLLILVGLTKINLETGAVNSTTLPMFQDDIWLQRFLGVDANDNFKLLAMNHSGGFGVLTVSPQSGELLNTPSYAGPISTTYEWYDTSYQYDSGRNAVYLIVTGAGAPRLLEYNLADSSTNIVQLSMSELYNIPSGCFDGVDNYYFMNIIDDNFSAFQLSSYSFASQQQSNNVNVTGISPNSDTYLYCANKQVYVLAYNTINPTNLTLYLLDTSQATATPIYSNVDTGLMNSLNLWFIDNYFVLLTLSSDTQEFYLTTVDLNIKQVVSTTLVQRAESMMSADTIFSFCLEGERKSIYYVAATPPSNLYIYTNNYSDHSIDLSTINIASGTVKNTTLSVNTLQNGSWFQRFLGVDTNGNFLILVENTSFAYSIMTVSPSGNLISSTPYVGSVKPDFTWYLTSYQYDSNRNSVYLIEGGPETGPQLFVYDFGHSATKVITLAMPEGYSIPSGCFDGQNNYYFMDVSDNDNSIFVLSYYSLATYQQSSIVNVTGIAPNLDTYLFSANKQIYAVTRNSPNALSLYLIDTVQATATLTYSDADTGLPFSLNLWFVDNYFVYLSLSSSDNQYYLTTIDLNSNQIVSQSQVQGQVDIHSPTSGVY
ncbi:hypothetical protein DFA_06962 [Cavenderia fasciculata]|uniref:Uncharacterized protein n=1 Tax=Cavenderia fasciculata TaxID=261658 RepID=F4PX56_CACFS|nr:uncharacterized protein DFA_06962 [Cavenderia fasciculata]EGG19859.1 hypothetical protein DFA_06962 [Cavenderia fasciculata]|eukprot:XP_004358205.1 hypothetical protein DFA_06962 [Cavenderia fasciculata]